ncbi:MAG: hypothetical protein U0746_20720 [Gemmataceae bacterium]
MTQFTYDGMNHLLTYKLLLPSSAYQETQYVYGVATSTLTSNDLLAAVRHPNKTTGAASSSEADTYTYDALGGVATYTDRNGTTHTYTNDILGRRIYDWVTTFGSGVSNATVILLTDYDGQGNASSLTSFNSLYQPANGVLRTFNGWGQMTREYQDHTWFGSTSSPNMQYRIPRCRAGRTTVGWTGSNTRPPASSTRNTTTPASTTGSAGSASST